MRNRTVGLMVIGIAVIMGFMIYSFNVALTDIVSSSCEHGPTCPMWGDINFQTNISIALMAFVIVIGLYLVFFSREERIVTRTKVRIVKQAEEKKDYKSIMEKLSPDERVLLEKVIEAQGTIFQSALVEKTGFAKVKVTRLLDRMEGQGLIERRRRGMTNVVILKHK